MEINTIILKLIYKARDFRSREMFKVLRKYAQGSVLDVGGGNFFLKAMQKGIEFNDWTVLEYTEFQIQVSNYERILPVLGDGCNLPFPENYFNTVINIQVLEHVFEPIVMIQEMACVLQENGYMILLIPQTSVIHMVPHHYYNFTRFWIEEVMKVAGMHILRIQPLGGVWSSMASHLVYFFLQSLRYPGLSTTEVNRNALFYILFPFMAIFSLIAIPTCLILSLGDLSEEPNNHLVVATKLPKKNKNTS